MQLKSEDRPIRKNSTSCKQHLNAGPSVKPQAGPSSNYEHRRVSALLRNVGEKTIVSVISGRFMGFYVNGFL